MFLKHRLLERHYRLDYLLAIEELTVRRRRPLARRRARTLRPSAVAMRLRKPCLLTRLRFEGWNVRFIAVFDLLCCVYVSLNPRTLGAGRFEVQSYIFFSTSETPAPPFRQNFRPYRLWPTPSYKRHKHPGILSGGAEAVLLCFANVTHSAQECIIRCVNIQRNF